jgi:hypothetical protein
VELAERRELGSNLLICKINSLQDRSRYNDPPLTVARRLPTGKVFMDE